MLNGRKVPTGAKPGLVRFCLAVEGGERWVRFLTLVSNTYVGAVGTLAEWKTASHIVWPQGGGDVSPAAPTVVN